MILKRTDGAPFRGVRPRLSPRSYMPGLDVVRGAAITMVVFYHGLAPVAAAQEGHLSHLQYVFLKIFDLGSMGVHLFFVLSGFLITGKLLDTRTDESFYKPFYIRRILRIVPIYLVMIGVLKLTNSISWRFTAVSLLYLCNVSSLLHSSPEYGSFWSLSVEEQFYLVWPLMIRKLSSSAIFMLSLAIVFGTPLLRLVLLYAPKALGDIHYKTWAVADFFAAGTLLAMLVRSSLYKPAMRYVATLCCITGTLSLSVAAWIPGAKSRDLMKLQEAFHLAPWVPLFAGIVLSAYLFPRIAALYVARPFIFLGRISYGLYIVHSFIFSLVQKYWPLERDSASVSHGFSKLLARFSIELTASIIIAALSRFTLEEFFLRRKPRQVHHVRDFDKVRAGNEE